MDSFVSLLRDNDLTVLDVHADAGQNTYHLTQKGERGDPASSTPKRRRDRRIRVCFPNPAVRTRTTCSLGAMPTMRRRVRSRLDGPSRSR
jgi:hypothetical protein